MKIYYSHFDDTLEYAVSELIRCVERMSEFSIIPTSHHVPALPRERKEGVLCLGLFSDLGLDETGIEDPFVDDVLDIDVEGCSGCIAGSNIRSILLGVYRWLRDCGARWVRPGDDGEYLPYCDFSKKSFKYRHAASYRYRGECIEGAVSFEHVRDTIIWLPRVGANMFFMEQVVPFNYISRWYFRTQYNTEKPDDPRTFEEVAEYTRQLELLTKKCGLQLHALGHGYTFEPYGVHYRTSADQYEFPPLAIEHSAQLNGKRGMYHSPNFTQLCLSNPEARRMMVGYLADYLEKKPYIDFLHVWLADAVNNHCECDECQKMIPTDYYMTVLNELDSELTKRGIDTRIVFIMYTDTWFPPEKNRLTNPDRFILLTAFNHNHSNPKKIEEFNGELPVYTRNQYNVPADFMVQNAFFKKWREWFKGDAFIFEYYFFTDHYNDPGYTALGKILLQDVRALKDIGCNGIVDDKTQRSFFPNGLPLSVLFEALYDENMDLDAFTDDYFAAAYGAKWREAKEYLTAVSTLFDPPSLRINMTVVEEDTGTGKTKEKRTSSWKNNPEAAANFARIPQLAASFAPIAKEALKTEHDPTLKLSWQYLLLHTRYVTELAGVLYAGASSDDMTEAKRLFEQHCKNLSKDEDLWHRHFDLYLYKRCFSRKF